MTPDARQDIPDPIPPAPSVGDRLRGHDWSEFPAGPPDAWPECLRSAVGLMLGSLSPMFVAWGADLHLVYNDAYAGLLGDRDATALGRPYREVWPDIWDVLSDFGARTLAGESIRAEDMPFTLSRDNREERVAYTFSASPLRDAAGAVAGIFCVCEETTGRVRGEAALRESEARTRGILEGMGEGFCLLDADFVIRQVNAEGLRLDGRPAHEIEGRPHAEAYPDVEGTPLGDLYRRCMAERVPGTIEHRYAFPDGRVAWFETRVYPCGDGLAIFYRDVTDRKAREGELAEAETRLRALADNLPRGVAFQILCPPDNAWRRFVYLSKGFEAMFGVEPGAALADAEAVYGLIPPEHRAMVDAIEARNVAEMLPFDGIVPLVRPDGRLVYGRSLSAPRRLPDGNILFDGIMLDETDSQLAEARLRESEARFQAIVDSIEQMVWSADADGTADFYNQRWYDYTGLPRGSSGGEGWAGLHHPDDAEATKAAWRRALATGEPYRVESRLRDATGRYRWALGRAQAVRDEAGAVTRWFGSYTDIQEIVEAREVLARSREALEREVGERTRELDRLWRLSRDLFGVCRADGVLRRANPAWTGALGLGPESLDGARFEDLVHPDDVAAAAGALARAAAGEPVHDLTLRMRAEDGGGRWLDWSLVPEGDLVYAAGRDVTDQRLAEDALRQSQKMEAVGQLTGGLAHDFNNLLTGIVGSLELLQSRVAQGRYENVPRYATAAMSSANRAAALTHRLLAFARRQPLDPKTVDVNRLVSSMGDLVRQTIGEMTGLEIVTGAGVWTTLCDPHQLENAVLNLTINARDAMPDGGRIAIATSNVHLDAAHARRNPGIEPGPYVCVSVSDTGCGMPPNVLARAFDPFFTTKPLGQGTGLGLSMIYGFARQSGGQALIESSPGAGTTVRLYLPRHGGEAPGEESGPGGLTEALRAAPGETVLVVEDEPVVRDLVVEVLADLGYRALQAADGPSGLKALQEPGRIDLLVTDVGLPGLNGRQMADQARVGRPDLRVLFITGYAENATFGKDLAGPDTQLITKPFTVEALAARIREMIAG